MSVVVAALLQQVWVNLHVLQATLWLEVMSGSPMTPWCRDQDRVPIQGDSVDLVAFLFHLCICNLIAAWPDLAQC